MTVKPLEDSDELRPKLINVNRSSSGFDFVLQTVGKSPKMSTGKFRQQLKGIAGHYVGTLDKEGVAYKAGLRQGHRLIEINGIQIEKESHSYVIAVIRASQSVQLLVVDEDTDEFFLRHGISPSSKHLDGKLELGLSPSPIMSVKRLPPSKPFISHPHSNVARTPSSLRDIADMRKMAMSTPNLSFLGKSKSENNVKSDRKDRSKREIKKRFSLFDKKKKSSYYKSSMELSPGRRLYDETII
uniref:PDZ domain-containing protein n=1 Tax=Ciona savignyi TaxID=51511 RepID=H2Y529_CIOSA